MKAIQDYDLRNNGRKYYGIRMERITLKQFINCTN